MHIELSGSSYMLLKNLIKFFNYSQKDTTQPLRGKPAPNLAVVCYAFVEEIDLIRMEIKFLIMFEDHLCRFHNLREVDLQFSIRIHGNRSTSMIGLFGQ